VLSVRNFGDPRALIQQKWNGGSTSEQIGVVLPDSYVVLNWQNDMFCDCSSVLKVFWERVNGGLGANY